ncbi:DUF1499 domain-containing protein [Afifella pfennigii]|uniref:DUF1499 domain-containing protein n=1 Tax=Afifella pfennigii TaxID=209897 RepID=UPI000689EC0A|nr:DUF1499 domain-containing protein [Afifella pfennigii]
MSLLAATPYPIILLGMCLGTIGVRPTLLAWATVMLGALSGLGAAVVIVVTGQPHSWGLSMVAALPFVIVALTTIKDLTYPLINDVSTDVDAPPRFEAALHAAANAGRDMAFPKRFAPIVRDKYPELRPLILREPKREVLERVASLMAEMPNWTATFRDDSRGLVEGEVRTPFLGFVDDVVVRVADDGGSTRVDMRSKSREGLVDGGANGKRVQGFLARLADA